MKKISETAQFKLVGLEAILFDRFIDMLADERPPDQKLYLDNQDQVGLLSENLWTFLFSEKPDGAAKRFEGRRWAEFLMAGQVHTGISPEFIPFMRDGKPIILGKFDEDGVDKKSGIKVFRHKALIRKGPLIIPCSKQRPCLSTPWEMRFEVTIFGNRIINMTKIFNWFERGGVEIGLGRYRPWFGRFMVEMI